MSLPILTLIFDRKKRASKEKEGVVELRITHYRSQKYLSTGVRVLPKEWKNGRVIRRDDAEELQESLELFVKEARKAINDMLAEGSVNLDEIKERMESMHRKKQTFIDFMAERTEIKKYGKAKDTRDRYDRFLKFIMSWGRIVFFSDITEAKVLELDKFLVRKRMKPYSRWQNYHRFLNSFIIDAIDEGLIRRNPYRWLHIEKDKASGLHKYLTKDELDRLRRSSMPTRCLEHVRDLFVFQTYTCLSYVDLASFDAKAIETSDDGTQVYTGERGKTKQEFTFVLLAPARDILRRYNGKLPVISNIKYNDYLKLVAQAAGIDKPITSHWARHTGATLLLNEGKVPMEVIARILGHSSTRQTRETYAALAKKTVAQEMSRLDGKI